ncbi:PGF-pre-PGF domain-containing protein [Candidatus Woesearchaeota archaeon]|nr:PGF-pre-PGF domain-containing protein [Candidatus Woesearchaeota archaeon]
MRKAKFSLLLVLSVVVLSSIVLADPGVWRGFVKITNSTGNNLSAEPGTPVDIYLNGIWEANTSTYSGPFPGYYFISSVGSDGDAVTFRIWGSPTDNATAESWSPGWHTGSDYGQWFNLTFTAISNSAACNHSKACSGGYCCNGGTEVLMAAPYSGTSGTCQASACSSSSSSSSSGGGGGGGGSSSSSSSGGGGGSSLVSETVSITGSVAAETGANFPFTKAADTGIGGVEVSLVSAITNPQVTVKETTLGSGQPVAIGSAVGAVYQYLSLSKVNFKDSDLSKAAVKFQVLKKWVVDNDIDYSSIVLNRLVNNEWVKLTTAFVKEDSTYYYFEAETPGFSVFAITGEKKSAQSKVTAFQITDAIRGFYAGSSSYTAFSLVDLIRKFYLSAGG